MDVYNGPNGNLPTLPDPVVTIGSFDGIHIGHRALLERVIERAGERGGTAVLLTFDPHPQRVVAPGTAPALLTTREEKLELLEESGLEAVVFLRFDRALSDMEAEDFVQKILVGRIGVRYLVFGHDHAFGRGRRGRPELLRRMAPDLGFEFEVMEAVRDNGETITSTLIRGHLEKGNVERANELLGRSYGVAGVVVRGERRGERIGIPTANVVPSTTEKCIPGNGVYAVRAEVLGEIYQGACNIGIRPTFGGEECTIEAHLFDFAEDIYGESIKVSFIKKLRDERSFDGPEALREQIGSDIEEARRILAQEVG